MVRKRLYGLEDAYADAHYWLNKNFHFDPKTDCERNKKDPYYSIGRVIECYSIEEEFLRCCCFLYDLSSDRGEEHVYLSDRDEKRTISEKPRWYVWACKSGVNPFGVISNSLNAA